MKVDASSSETMSALANSMREDLRIGGESRVGPGAARTLSEASSFGAVLEKTALAASTLSREANAKADAVAQGKLDDLHGTMITMKEADISMKLVGSVRDKLLDAFHELWRINV
jgi:flagellar hook-basal body complex protein FliE